MLHFLSPYLALLTSLCWLQSSLDIPGGLVTGSTWISKFMDTQVLYIKWCSTVSLVCLQLLHLYIEDWLSITTLDVLPTWGNTYLCICLPSPPYCEQPRAMTLPRMSFSSPLLCIETSRCLNIFGGGKNELDWMVHLELEVSEVYYSILVATPAVMTSCYEFLMGFFSVLEK